MAKQSIPILDLCRRYEAIYTGSISDILDEMGYTSQVLPSEIVPVLSGMRLAGEVFTAQGAQTTSLDPDEIFVPLLRMYGEVTEGSVLVSKPNDNSAAHMGELSATALQARGCRGAVIDGGARDIDYIANIGFPVFSRYTTPADIVGRWRLDTYGDPVEIGKTKVSPGDFVVADADGVVVVPKDVKVEVLLQAEEVVSTEDKVREAITGGMLPLDAYRKYGRF